MKREPLLTVGGIVALVTATIGLLVAFGVDISQDQQVAILEVVAVAAPVAVALIARHWVWSPEGVDMEVEGKTSEVLAEAAFDTGFDDEDPDVEEAEDDEDEADEELTAALNV